MTWGQILNHKESPSRLRGWRALCLGEQGNKVLWQEGGWTCVVLRERHLELEGVRSKGCVLASGVLAQKIMQTHEGF